MTPVCSGCEGAHAAFEAGTTWSRMTSVSRQASAAALSCSRLPRSDRRALREQITPGGLVNRDGGRMVELPLNRDGIVASEGARHPTDALHVVQTCEIRLEDEGGGEDGDPGRAEVPAGFRGVGLPAGAGAGVGG